jgi:DNA-binding PadR family transcriptional regulator
MTVRLGLLGLLRDAPTHGYELKLRYDELLDPDRPVQPAQVYSTLNRLERDGLVASVNATDNAQVKRVYEATDRGIQEIDAWLAEPVTPEPHLHTVLYVKVVLVLLTGRSVEDLLDTQREAHLVRMRELTGVRQSPDVAASLLADYALFHLESDLRWLELTAGRVDEIARRVARRSYAPRGMNP